VGSETRSGGAVPNAIAPPDLAFLRRVKIFQDISDPHLVALWAQLRERRLRKGEVLFRAGDPGEEMFLIRTGSIVVSSPVQGRVEQVLVHLGPGDFFGEMSLFDEAPRSATIQAATDVLLLNMSRQSLLQFIESNPRAAAALLSQMVRVMSSRLRASTELVAEVTRWGLEATGLDVEQTLPE
jgi:CRP/FNR family cyclic AMP-dependent transcriptional regulator